MSIYSVRTLTTDDELLEAAAWCRDRTIRNAPAEYRRAFGVYGGARC